MNSERVCHGGRATCSRAAVNRDVLLISARHAVTSSSLQRPHHLPDCAADDADARVSKATAVNECQQTRDDVINTSLTMMMMMMMSPVDGGGHDATMTSPHHYALAAAAVAAGGALAADRQTGEQQLGTAQHCRHVAAM